MSIERNAKKQRHPLVDTLLTLKGNQKACVLTEPLWGIPFNLYSPYVSLYMVALGMKDSQIGLIISIGLALQFVWSLLSGAITDKLGRRWTTFLFDLVSWGVPMVLWAVAQNYWYFFAAAICNAVWRVTSNSWSCMLIEDGDDRKLVSIFTLVDIMAIISGFVAPIVGIFIEKYTLVPTIRVIYWISFVMMTSKFFILLFASKETTVGKRRMEETKGVSLLSVLASSKDDVLKQLLRTRSTVLAMLFLALLACFTTVQGAFWPLFVSEKYHISDSFMAIFPMVRASVLIVVYFFVTPRIRPDNIKKPLFFAIGAHSVWIVLLLCCMPLGSAGVPVVIIGTVFEALGAGIVGPVSQTLLALNVDAKERARIYSFAYALVLLLSAPAGWIAGQLSNFDRALPLAFNLLLAAALGLIVLLLSRTKNVSALQEESSAE